MTKYSAVILGTATGEHPSCNYEPENSETKRGV